MSSFKFLKVKKNISGRFAYRTDVGKVRISNEDQAGAYLSPYGTVLMIVCDGMGGQNKGDLASSLCISYIKDSFHSVSRFHGLTHVKWWLFKTIRKANSTIFNEANKTVAYHGMGTTLSVALLYRGYLIVAQVGDSRVYKLNKESVLEQLSDDQTYVGYLYRTGQISKEEMKTHPKRHMLMNAVGIYPTVNVDVKVFPYDGETLLVCSDGLYNNVPDSSIESVLKSNDNPEQKVSELISIGNGNGGSDNIGVVVWEAKK